MAAMPGLHHYLHEICKGCEEKLTLHRTLNSLFQQFRNCQGNHAVPLAGFLREVHGICEKGDLLQITKLDAE